MLIDANQLDTRPPEWLVGPTRPGGAGLIPRVGAGFIWGPSRWGKSLLTNGELALAVANGTDFFGRPTIQGTVAVCLGEGQYDAGVRKQVRLAREEADRVQTAAQIAVRHGDDVARKFLDNLPPYTDANLKFMTEPFELPIEWGTHEPHRSLRAAISALSQIPDLELVILDAYSDFSGGLSIANEASANRGILGMKMMVKALNCCVLCVAHPAGKKGGSMGGSQRLFNAADFVIKIEPEETGPFGMPSSATVVSEKSKYGRMFEPFGYTIHEHEWDEPELDYQDQPTGNLITVSSATVRPRDDEQAIVRRPRPEPKPLPRIRSASSGRPQKRSGILRSIGTGVANYATIHRNIVEEDVAMFLAFELFRIGRRFRRHHRHGRNSRNGQQRPGFIRSVLALPFIVIALAALLVYTVLWTIVNLPLRVIVGAHDSIYENRLGRAEQRLSAYQESKA